MIRVLIGDLFESSAQTLVNTVNCVGVMGKGIALDFKRRFPDMFDDYERRCEAGAVRLGQPYVFRSPAHPWILNFPTKGHWRAVSRLSDIVLGLEHLEARYQSWGITSIACPPLGCSNGQLEWRVVGPTLYQHLSRLEIPVELYAPFGTPDDQISWSFLTRDVELAETLCGSQVAGRIPAAWIALVEIVARIDRETYHYPIGRTALQKIAYFATSDGLPTGLDYVEGSYGPFSKEMKRAEAQLVNNGLLLEEQRGQAFIVRPGPTYASAVSTYCRDLSRWESTIARVADLFLRLDTRRAEIAATVHFVASRPGDCGSEVSEQAILEGVKLWKQNRKPPLSDAEIATAIRDLNLLGWITARPSIDLPLPCPEPAEDNFALV